MYTPVGGRGKGLELFSKEPASLPFPLHSSQKAGQYNLVICFLTIIFNASIRLM